MILTFIIFQVFYFFFLFQKKKRSRNTKLSKQLARLRTNQIIELNIDDKARIYVGSGHGG